MYLYWYLFVNTNKIFLIILILYLQRNMFKSTPIVLYAFQWLLFMLITYHNYQTQWYALLCLLLFFVGARDFVRLVNSVNKMEGRVEVFINGTWGTICDGGFTVNDARVICRVLGYERYIAYFALSYLNILNRQFAFSIL